MYYLFNLKKKFFLMCHCSNILLIHTFVYNSSHCDAMQKCTIKFVHGIIILLRVFSSLRTLSIPEIPRRGIKSLDHTLEHLKRANKLTIGSCNFNLLGYLGLEIKRGAKVRKLRVSPSSKIPLTRTKCKFFGTVCMYIHGSRIRLCKSSLAADIESPVHKVSLKH